MRRLLFAGKGPLASTLYPDSTVGNGSTYYDAAGAVDVAGQESVKSALAKAVVR